MKRTTKLEHKSYLETHETNGPIVVSCAKNGFLSYEGSQELLNIIRMSLPSEEDPSWKDFKIVVDKFLGDVVRRRFCPAIQQLRMVLLRWISLVSCQ